MAGGLLGALIPEQTKESRTSDATAGCWCVARRAMACDFSIFLPPLVGDPMAVGGRALDLIEDMESLLSVYRADSAVTYLNQNAADHPVRTDNRLVELLARADELHQITDGAVDPASGALIRAWGFYQGPRRVPTEAERQEALARSGMRHVLLDRNNLTVTYQVPGIEINLGSIGKGYAIDRAIRCLREEFGIDSALMQGGSSSIHGLGRSPVDERGWQVGIENPYDPSKTVARVWLRDKSLGTSGTANQFFEENGRRYGHLLDPRTGWPADQLASASVLASDGITADALATALFVMGLDKARVFCKDHPEIGAVLVRKPSDDGSPEEPLRVVTLNIAKEDVDLRSAREDAD